MRCKMAKLEWEAIDNYHERAKIFGGWLVKAYSLIEHAAYSESGWTWQREQSQEMQVTMTFVPDAKHEWNLDNQGEENE